ncbi:hypothetical protein C8Q80DRAFT_1186678 [Daedaleopsis nitida]|nr:hypothetical protein C8Q80DRAFT_1186678 [Daedaleopsis nitida]
MCARSWLPSTATWLQGLQTIMAPQQDEKYQTNTGDEIWMNTLTLTVAAAAVSAFMLSFQLLGRTANAGATGSDVVSETSGHAGPRSSHVAQSGSIAISALRIVRMLSSFALLALSIADFVLDQSNSRWLSFSLVGTYTYASLLAFGSIASCVTLSALFAQHLAAVLLFTWAVYAYRDLWPLATFNLQPADAQGLLLWAKVALLTVAAIVVPILAPREYIPVDPKNPAAEPNPEQTASILSFFSVSFLDPLIWKGYRVPHIPFDELPPLADYDYASNLVKRAFPHLDPTRLKHKHHIFWRLMTVFMKEYIILACTMIIEVVAEFASPLAVYQLLHYLELGGDGASIRPWVWIAMLFCGRLVRALANLYYLFMTTSTLVRAEAIMTQLVFDHALRIRMKADTGASAPSDLSAETTPAESSENVSVPQAEPHGMDVHDTDSLEGSDTGSVHASTSAASTATLAKSGDAPNKIADSQDNADSSQRASGSVNLVGKMNNLVTSDLNNLTWGRHFLYVVLYAPLQIVFAVCFLYTILGWSIFIGLVVMVLLFPVPGSVASKIQRVQTEKMRKSDARVQNVTETMSVIRMIKLFGWELRAADQLATKREDELTYIRKYKILEIINHNINIVIPILTMVATYTTYTAILGNALTASKVFSSLTVFNVLRDQLHIIFDFVPGLIRAKVSLERVSDFLDNSELLDAYADAGTAAVQNPATRQTGGSDVIGIRNASFTWSRADNGLRAIPSGHEFTLRIADEVTFMRGGFTLIVGPTGAGKTSLLMALLGELHYVPGGVDSFVSLPRAGGVAYAAQESWVQNETIRDNIVFGAPFDEERYRKVIYQCALERDLALFDAGDQTEVGEKGLTLSGGQKARVTLARAVYSQAELLLLDDILAALDVHTARWIVDRCFKGDILRGRTVILVTHNVALAGPIADFVISLGAHGRVKTQGSLSKVLAKDDKLAQELAEEREEIKKTENGIDHVAPAEAAKDASKSKATNGKLVVSEELATGQATWEALRLYMSSMGGGHSLVFFLSIVILFILNESFNVLQTYWLGYWGDQYDGRDPREVKVFFYIAIYILLMVGAVSFYCSSYIVFLFGSLRASRSMHKLLVGSVLGATLRWLDMTPTARIITRCTQDIQTIDGRLAGTVGLVFEATIIILVRFIAVVSLSPVFIVPGIVVSALGVFCGRVYMKTQLSVKREMSNARAPVLGHFSAAVSGLTSIRAYGAQEQFRKESFRRIDNYVRVRRTFYNLNRWISIRIDILSAAFAASLAAYLVYGSGAGAADTGFSLNVAVGFTSLILWWIRILNDLEVEGNSVERVQQYLAIEHEPSPTTTGVPPAYWPASGHLKVENLSARYSADGPRVLHELSFEIKSGERVGIVGRTGSGKSSLTLALLRLILTEGKVYFDGLATDEMNLDALRAQVTIIPQVPELLSGTLRENLDPFGQHDDAVLNDALRAAGLFSLQLATAESPTHGESMRLTLDSPIASSGGNLSVGQRQIVALARAIVRRSKLLVLDEATSAIDYETDTFIQNSLREQLGPDVTVITVAHRLQTVMDADKIMVLDAGRIAEFGTPSVLLQNEKGLLRALVEESGDRERLYEMAGA